MSQQEQKRAGRAWVTMGIVVAMLVIVVILVSGQKNKEELFCDTVGGTYHLETCWNPEVFLIDP